MSNSIGFRVSSATRVDWTGPVALSLRLHSIHTLTARYQCQLRQRVFDLYVPFAMIFAAAAESPPELLRIAIARSPGPLRSIGFSGEARPVTQSAELWEYDFEEEKVNAKKYVTHDDGQNYGVYVLNEIFDGAPHPSRIFLRIELQSESRGQYGCRPMRA